MLVQAVYQLLELRAQIWEALATGGVFFAVAEEQFQRALSVAGGKKREAHVRRRNTIQDDGAGVVGMLACVDDSSAGAIGTAVDVDLCIAEELAYVIQIVHGDGGCVLGDVGFVFEGIKAGVEALHHHGHGIFDVVIFVFFSLGRFAFQRIGFSGAALVNEDDVAAGLNAVERFFQNVGHGSCALTGAASEEEERIGCGVLLESGKNEDFESDFATGFGLAIFPDAEGTAVGVGRPFAGSARLQMINGGIGMEADAGR